MFIKDLQPRQTGVDVEGEVIEMSDVREFNKFGKAGKVANALIKDGTGRVKLSLWNEQIEKVKVGDTVKIHNGYVGEFQGELQLTTGKFGTIEVSGSSAKVESAKEVNKEAPVALKKETEMRSDEISDDEEDDNGPGSSDVEEEDLS